MLDDEYTRGTAFTLDPVEKAIDDDESYEESSTGSINVTQKVTGKKRKAEQPESSLLQNLMDGLHG